MQSKLRKAARAFIPNFPEHETFAVTLTMKQHAHTETLDRQAAEKNLRHFLNRLNRKCFGSAAVRRHNKRVEVIPVLEKSYSGRLHYHLTLRNPLPDRPFFFKQMIGRCWSETKYADKHIDIQEAYDVQRWNSYITKQHTKNIDWNNYHAE
ncbi:MAG: hypothetical protein JKX71_15480 [Amylibacter sp.]|nr:hypothetical protein [Amylibacter sp.]